VFHISDPPFLAKGEAGSGMFVNVDRAISYQKKGIATRTLLRRMRDLSTTKFLLFQGEKKEILVYERSAPKRDTAGGHPVAAAVVFHPTTG
jgi:hypothetical protein